MIVTRREMTDKLTNVKQTIDQAKEVVARLQQKIPTKCIRDTGTSVDPGDNEGENDIQESNQIKQELSEDLERLEGLLEKARDTLDEEIEERQTTVKNTEKKSGFSIPFCSRSPKTVPVLLKDQNLSTKDFMRELQEEEKKKAVFDLIDDVSGLHEKFIVVCPFASRLEPDIDFSLEGVDKSKLLVVVVLHQVRQGREPALSTQKKIGQQEKYSGIRFIDIAFNTDQKIYSCEMNKKAKSDIKAILEKA